jgi:hypothetical protein
MPTPIHVDATTVVAPDDMEEGVVYYDVPSNSVRLAVIKQQSSRAAVILRDSIAFFLGAVTTGLAIFWIAWSNGWRP